MTKINFKEMDLDESRLYQALNENFHPKIFDLKGSYSIKILYKGYLEVYPFHLHCKYGIFSLRFNLKYVKNPNEFDDTEIKVKYNLRYIGSNVKDYKDINFYF